MASTNGESPGVNNPSRRPLRVCFVVLDAYPAIDPRVEGGIGGVETRSWMLARALAAREDFDVSIMIRCSQSVLQTEYEGVTLLPVYDRFSNIRNAASRSVRRSPTFPGLKFREFRLRLLWQLPLLALYNPFRPVLHSRVAPAQPVKLFTDIDADVVCGFGVNVVTAAIVASAKATGKKSILFIASDIDLDERYTADSNFVNIYQSPARWCHYAVANADRVIVQTPEQLQLLRRHFDRAGELIGNPIDLQEWDERLQTAKLPGKIGTLDDYVLWVGRAEKNQKQPQLMPALARLCPDIPFLMILNPGDKDLENEIRSDAPENLIIIDKIPFPAMPAVYKHAAVLVNTSDSEGFPNTFLQAAATGVPIASLKVGTGFLTQSGAGECAEGDMERLCQIVSDYAQTRKAVDAPVIREFIEQNHGLEWSVSRVRNLLQELSTHHADC